MKLRFASLLKWVLVLICVLLIYKTVMDLGPRNVWAAAVRADASWVLAAIVVLSGRFLVWAWKWFRMLRRRWPLGFGLVLRLIFAGSLLNLITPTAKLGGGFFRAAVLRQRLAIRLADAYGWVMADQATNLLGNILLFGLVLLGASLAFPEVSPWLTFIPGGFLCFAAVAAWLAGRDRLWRWVQKPGTGQWFIRRIPKRFRREGAGKGRWRKAIFEPLMGVGGRMQVVRDLVLGALSLGFLCWSNALVLKGLGVSSPLATVALVVLLGYLAGSVLGPMGGVGVTELFLIKLYTMAGVPGEAAAAGALLHRGIFYLFQIVFGGWALWREGWRNWRPALASEEDRV